MTSSSNISSLVKISRLLSSRISIIALSAEPSQIHALYLANSINRLLHKSCSYTFLQPHIYAIVTIIFIEKLRIMRRKNQCSTILIQLIIHLRLKCRYFLYLSTENTFLFSNNIIYRFLIGLLYLHFG